MRHASGTLDRMRSYLEEVNSSRDKTVYVGIDILLTYTQQTVLLLGQTITSLLYHCRHNPLFSCMPYNDLKSLLKERSGTMGNEGDLVGKELEISEMRISFFHCIQTWLSDTS